MKILPLLFVAALTTTTLIATAQVIQGYSFQNYPATVVMTKKAPLNLSSNRVGKTYRTAITQQYNKGKVDFGGHYITTAWGAGTGQTLGAMVDVITGKIYALPLNEENSNRGVYHDNNNNITYKPNSNLFVCYASTANPDNSNKVDLTYYFYKWNEAKKRFELLNTKKVTTDLIDN